MRPVMTAHLAAAALLLAASSELQDGGCDPHSATGCLEESEESAIMLQMTNSPQTARAVPIAGSGPIVVEPQVQKVSTTNADYSSLIGKDDPDLEAGTSNSESVSIGIISLGIVVMLMSFFYSLHQSDIAVRGASWKTLTNMISFFCAALLFACLKDLGVLFLQEAAQSGPTVLDLLIAFVRLSALFLVVQVALFASRFSDLALKISGTFGAHVLVFAGMDAFGAFEQFVAGSESWPMSLVPAGLSALCVLCVCCVASIVRYVVLYAINSRQIAEHNLAWDTQCIDTETDFGSITIGFLLSLVSRAVIVGKLPPSSGAPEGVSQWQIWVVFMVSLALLVVAAITTLIVVLMIQRAWSPRYIRCMQIVQLATSSIAAFNLVAWSQWQWRSEGHTESEQVTARMLVALSFSGLVFTVIFLQTFTTSWTLKERKAIEVLMVAMGLLLGISWHSIYDIAVRGVGGIFEGQTTSTLVNVGLRVGVCVVLLPAWGLYILPKAMPDKATIYAVRGNGSSGQ
eukprot:gnl/TRDRNA2_/TRDRNA2_185904_c0_seq1.p1 gnl/TRDRNA2_/TRDRNA2_185904_c0~~gnl/TRDRNA2_/TRDRNA2_185904_c0_seq1.p1  ORF type:complete len:514 (-),score=76.12 gnl/TRDRNA2_/TRDRNA2_185904_c0_seq1:42-1583(-)